jgi:hypothetical protein
VKIQDFFKFHVGKIQETKHIILVSFSAISSNIWLNFCHRFVRPLYIFIRPLLSYQFCGRRIGQLGTLNPELWRPSMPCPVMVSARIIFTAKPAPEPQLPKPAEPQPLADPPPCPQQEESELCYYHSEWSSCKVIYEEGFLLCEEMRKYFPIY